MSRQRRILLLGTPNSGKSTLFNALVGGGARVGNFPGTTVEKLEGQWTLPDGPVAVVDLPGSFSLAARSPEERVAIEAVLATGVEAPDLVVLVADAPRLSRSLYLLAQVLELEVPVVVALNLVDEVGDGAEALDVVRLTKLTGVPIVPTVARNGVGIETLKEAVANVLRNPSVASPGPLHGWGGPLAHDLQTVADAMSPTWGKPSKRVALASWLLLVAHLPEAAPDGSLELPLDVARRVRNEATAAGRDLDAELVGTRYAWIDAQLPGLRKTKARAVRSEAVDRLVLHPFFGLVLFLGVMGGVFAALFAGADPIISVIERGISGLGDVIQRSIPPGTFQEFLVHGVIAGVGSVVVFLPQIALLFLFLTLLEDCGYLARAAHLMDRILRAAGLPGAAFVPLLSGFACAVPAILASRTMPRFRDRLLTMLVVPLTSCSARLPVYTLVIGALFPETAWGLPARPLALLGMYVFSSWVTIGAAIVLGRWLLPGSATSALIELPPYRMPVLRNVVTAVVDRCRDFLHEAGRIILIASVVLWALLSFPAYESSPGTSPEFARAEALEHSFGGRMGKAIEPAIAPLGMDWQVGIGLVGAFAAREVFVATLGIVYGLGDVDEEDLALRDRLRMATGPDGKPVFTVLSGLSIMVFFALSMQCLSTLAVLKKETGGWRWPTFVFVYMTALAWGTSFVVFQGGRALGFE